MENKVMTTLASDLISGKENMHLDNVCKEILAEKIILAWIMKHTMSEYASIPLDEIIKDYILSTPSISEVLVNQDVVNTPKIPTKGVEDTSINEGKVTFDILFKAMIPETDQTRILIIDIEAQKSFYPGYPLTKRSAYYCGRMISSQYGTVFTQSNYQLLQKVYSVWICMSPPAAVQNSISKFSMMHVNTAGYEVTTSAYDLVSSIMIYLGDENKAEHGSLLRLLDVVFSNKLPVETKFYILENEFSIKMTEEMKGKVSYMCNFSEGFYDRGYNDGFLLGEAAGKDAGIIKATLDHIQKLMSSLHYSAEQAMDVLNIDDENKKYYCSLLLAEGVKKSL